MQKMNGRTCEHAHQPEAHKRQGPVLEHQILEELRTLELLIASGEDFQDVLEECAQRLSAMELADARSEHRDRANLAERARARPCQECHGGVMSNIDERCAIAETLLIVDPDAASQRAMVESLKAGRYRTIAADVSEGRTRLESPS